MFTFRCSGECILKLLPRQLVVYSHSGLYSSFHLVPVSFFFSLAAMKHACINIKSRQLLCSSF